MNRKEMLRRIKAGDKPIDIFIDKWIDILEGIGYDLLSNNCATCELYKFPYHNCPLDVYKIISDNLQGGCGGYYHTGNMKYYDKQCMLSFLYAVKEEMIKDGVY